MKRNLKTSLLSGLVIFATVALAGCGNSASTNSAAPNNSNASSPSTKASVGIVLPTKAESRWPMAQKEFEQAVPGATILYSNGDTATEKTNVESLISKGVKVIVICPQDATAAAAEVNEAHAKGIQVVSYDRLIMNTPNVNYYVTFDSVAVGAAQAKYLVDNAKGTGNHLYLYAGALSDNNAFLFFQGAWSVLQPKIADGTFEIENSSVANSLKNTATLSHDQLAQIIGQITTNWDPATAKTLAQANLAKATAAQKGACYVLAPNDDTSRSITDTFRADKAVTQIYSTGQDFTQASLQYILDGKQSMTVWKSDKVLVDDVKQIVDAIQNNAKPSVIVTTYNNGKADVPSTKAPLTIVTKDNAESTINSSGMYTVSNGKVSPVK
ncbi:monosaccharide ABC transporter substrate-binding protein, CUT2 family [Desulfosporosinus acidiphilus SJ4]|uniref:Monosaccharide ABC transporter substrate-binding protein, CUT2 family n=1 Tax=Desulfosporosinus acidiphilus (strain DSM 22704 / JCM 16185 / SJ4) TaxID=646529 RepID=I4D2P7_DESAJ|nr:sugar-binding protein [Desulfosporosinus acidiphilus]AFM40071.1 monosaccharide ABC transporter substrate-binding protein, CUT2 family [Desulfosporosinus acidiphilus SJ4]